MDCLHIVIGWIIQYLKMPTGILYCFSNGGINSFDICSAAPCGTTYYYYTYIALRYE